MARNINLCGICIMKRLKEKIILVDKQESKPRQSNFELLRIIAMFLIVIHHSMYHGALVASNATILAKGTPLTISLFNAIAFGGKMGVYIFVLITGYFMINSNISLKKVAKLWLPVFFWSVVLTIVVGSITHRLTIVDIIKCIFPIIFNQYWFMTTYIFMYLLIPIMNLALHHTNLKQEVLLVVLGLTIIFPGVHFYGTDVNILLIKFCIAYCLGAMIRKHDLLRQNWFKKLGIILLWFSILIDCLFAFTSTYLGFTLQNLKFIRYSRLVDEGLTIFCFLAAIGLFAWMGSKQIGYHRWINIVASTTFGIYLIHDNKIMENFLWLDILHMKSIISQPAYVVLYILLVCLIVFAVCSLLEYIRKILFSKLENKMANNFTQVANRLVDKVFTLAKAHL